MNCTIDFILDINGTHTVLVKRKKEPFKGYWALPGGRVKENEEMENAVAREVEEETGLKINILSKDVLTYIQLLKYYSTLEQIKTYTSGTDPRGGHTTVFAAHIRGNPEDIIKYIRNGDDAEEAKVFKLDDIPELAFAHNKFIEDYCKYKRFQNPIPTTDLFIEYESKKKKGIVLIKRKNPPYGYALPGGFAEKGLTLEQNAAKEAKEETNLDIEIENPGRPLVFSSPNRDPRDHMISNLYFAKGKGELNAGDDAKTAGLYTIKEVIGMLGMNQFAFDHEDIIIACLKQKRYIK